MLSSTKEDQILISIRAAICYGGLKGVACIIQSQSWPDRFQDLSIRDVLSLFTQLHTFVGIQLRSISRFFRCLNDLTFLDFRKYLWITILTFHLHPQ